MYVTYMVNAHKPIQHIPVTFSSLRLVKIGSKNVNAGAFG